MIEDEAARRFRRLEEDAREREQRLRKIELVLARLPDLEGDVRQSAKDCKAIRKWVEERDRERERKEAEKERLSLGWWAAIIGGVAVFLSSVIGAIAQLAG